MCLYHEDFRRSTGDGLVGNWCAQSERDWCSCKLDPDGERVIANLLSCEALGAGYAAWNSDGDLGCAGVAGCADGDAGDGLCGGIGNVG